MIPNCEGTDFGSPLYIKGWVYLSNLFVGVAETPSRPDPTLQKFGRTPSGPSTWPPLTEQTSLSSTSSSPAISYQLSTTTLKFLFRTTRDHCPKFWCQAWLWSSCRQDGAFTRRKSGRADETLSRILIQIFSLFRHLNRYSSVVDQNLDHMKSRHILISDPHCMSCAVFVENVSRL